MTAVCVYCASSRGNNQAYLHAAKSLGNAIAKSGRQLVYGGGQQGLMGVVSGAVLENGGNVTGVTPLAIATKGGERPAAAKLNGERYYTEWCQDEYPNYVSIVVDDMHTRKVEMAKRADGGFIALPGGYGTFEELLEVITWSQLAIHVKPIIIVNVLGYYSPLKEQIQMAIDAGFVNKENFQLVNFVDGPESHESHASFDWGEAIMKVLDIWKPTGWKGFGYDWTKTKTGSASPLHAI